MDRPDTLMYLISMVLIYLVCSVSPGPALSWVSQIFLRKKKGPNDRYVFDSGGVVATTVMVVVVWLVWLLHPPLSIVIIVVLLLLLLLLPLHHVGTLRVPCSLLIVVFFPLFVIVIVLGPPRR